MPFTSTRQIISASPDVFDNSSWDESTLLRELPYWEDPTHPDYEGPSPSELSDPTSISLSRSADADKPEITEPQGNQGPSGHQEIRAARNFRDLLETRDPAGHEVNKQDLHETMDLDRPGNQTQQDPTRNDPLIGLASVTGPEGNTETISKITSEIALRDPEALRGILDPVNDQVLLAGKPALRDSGFLLSVDPGFKVQVHQGPLYFTYHSGQSAKTESESTVWPNSDTHPSEEIEENDTHPLPPCIIPGKTVSSLDLRREMLLQNFDGLTQLIGVADDGLLGFLLYINHEAMLRQNFQCRSIHKDNTFYVSFRTMAKNFEALEGSKCNPAFMQRKVKQAIALGLIFAVDEDDLIEKPKPKPIKNEAGKVIGQEEPTNFYRIPEYTPEMLSKIPPRKEIKSEPIAELIIRVISNFIAKHDFLMVSVLIQTLASKNIPYKRAMAAIKQAIRGTDFVMLNMSNEIRKRYNIKSRLEGKVIVRKA